MWNSAAGWGFIKPDGGGPDVFCHANALRKQREDNKALRAKFGISPDDAEALAPFGVMPRANEGRTVADVRAGLLPRRDAARGTTE